MKKKGNILVENIIFIILNLAFITIIILYISLKTGDTAVLEEVYAKQIALLIDNAEPNMTIGMDLSKGIEIAEKNGKALDKIVTIDEEQNKIIVSLSEKGGHSYIYFSDYDISIFLSENKLSILIR